MTHRPADESSDVDGPAPAADPARAPDAAVGRGAVGLFVVAGLNVALAVFLLLRAASPETEGLLGALFWVAGAGAGIAAVAALLMGGAVLQRRRPAA